MLSLPTTKRTPTRKGCAEAVRPTAYVTQRETSSHKMPTDITTVHTVQRFTITKYFTPVGRP